MAIAAILFSIVTHAQISKGAHMVGGSLGFGTQKLTNWQGTESHTEKATSFTVFPAWGYAVSDNFVLGADLTFTQFSASPGSGNKSYAKGGGLFVRQYWEVLPKFYVFGQARAGVNFAEYNYGANTSMIYKEKTSQVLLYVTPGISYAVSKKLQLEALFIPLFNFQYFKSDQFYRNDVKTSSKYYSVNTSLNNTSNLALGVRFLLGNK